MENKLIIIIISLIFFECGNPLEKNINNHNNMFYNGLVDDKFKNIREHNSHYVIVKNKKISVGEIFYDRINIGDSIVKKENTNHILIYKNSNLKNVLFFHEFSKHYELDTNKFNVKFWK